MNPSQTVLLQLALIVTCGITLLHWKSKASPKIEIWYDEMAQLASVETAMLGSLTALKSVVPFGRNSWNTSVVWLLLTSRFSFLLLSLPLPSSYFLSFYCLLFVTEFSFTWALTFKKIPSVWGNGLRYLVINKAYALKMVGFFI